MQKALQDGIIVGPARSPTWIQAAILVVAAATSVMVIALVGPTLPAMQRHFASVPNVEFLVPSAMAAPQIMMALLCVVAGILADRVGRKKLLVGATLLYALVGTAPLYLESLYAIIASRLMLGALEAVLVTVATTLIGDYYQGPARVRMMAMQAMMTAAAAFLLNYVGGAMGELGWRAPYGAYLVCLLLVPLMAIYLWEPDRRAGGEAQAEDGRPDVPFRPWLLAGICAVMVLSGLSFLVLPVNFGYLQEALGVRSPTQIGIAYCVNSLGAIVGTICFGWVIAARLCLRHQLALMAALTGAGFLLMQWASSYLELTFAGFVNGLGAGLLIPVVLTWAMRTLPRARRGMGIGAVQSSVSLGMFLSPPLVVGLDKLLGGRGAAIGAMGWALAVAAVLALCCTTAWKSRPAIVSS